MTNPFSTGQGGATFEISVQTAFTLNMIVNGNIPFLPEGNVEWIKLQGRDKGFQTDDFILCLKSCDQEYKLLAQIKRDISINSKTDDFNKVIKEFWSDYNNTTIFNKDNDIIVLIKGGLLKGDKTVKTLLDWAKTTNDGDEFLEKLDKGKKDIYFEFQTALVNAKGGSLTSDEIWRFLKKVYILSYDFDFAVQSQYQANVETLINITKRTDIEKTGKEIWAILLEFISKRDFTGSKITKNILQEAGLLKLFKSENLVPCKSAINKLTSNADISFKSITETIGNSKHLERKELKETFIESVFKNKFLIITGEPGVGKTAFINRLLRSLSKEECTVLGFKAVQFAKSQLAETLSSIGVNENIKEILGSISLLPSKIIFIDDIHKLSGIENDNAFRELLAFISENSNIYFIATCRTYAYEKILLKYSNWFNDVLPFEIPLLSDAEIQELIHDFPALEVLMKNERLLNLLKVPQYIDYGLRSKLISHDSNISVAEFKNAIWDIVVKGIETNTNSHQKLRERLFERIAIEKAKKLLLFVNVDDNDITIAEMLKEDNILIEENDHYSPSHDTLEDIALNKYINKHYINNQYDLAEFFNVIGDEPAIFRAFHLWVSDKLNQIDTDFERFILEVLADSQIPSFWLDELIHALLLYEYSIVFFLRNKELLLKQDAKIFRRFYHVLNGMCIKYNYLASKDFNPYAFTPYGVGWSVLTEFVVNNMGEIGLGNDDILELFINWIISYRGYKDKDTLGKKVGDVTLEIIKQVSYSYETKHLVKLGLRVVLNLSLYFKAEIKSLLKESLEYKKERKKKLNYDSKVYDTFIDMMLSQSDSIVCCMLFPNEVCELLKVCWYDTKEEIYIHGANFSLPNEDRKHNFGLKGYLRNNYPSSSLKTPILNLLNFNYKIALGFIVELINYTTEVFVTSEYNKDDEIIQVSIDLGNGKKNEQIGALTLWCMYRGTYVATPNLLQSVLMCLEKWFLSLTDINDKEKALFAFDYLISKSKSVATTAILISTAIANNLIFGRNILKLLTIKEFYQWEWKRKFYESTALSPVDLNNHFVQKERYDSNNLPHRSKGIDDLVRDLTFTIYKNSIFDIIDKLYLEAKPEELSWRKILNEIDFRRWGITKEIENGFEIAPTRIDEDIIEWQKNSEPMLDLNLTKNELYLFTIKVFDNEKDILNSIDGWRRFYAFRDNLISNASDEKKYFYSQKDLANRQLVLLAAIGMRDYFDDLQEDEQMWCYNLVLDSVVEALKYRFDQYSFKSTSVSMVLPYIFRYTENANKDEIKKIIIASITIVDEETKKHSIEGIKRYLWEIDKEFSETCIKTILEYNQLHNSFSYHYRMLYSDDSDKHLNIIQSQQLEFIDSIVNESKKPDVSKINFDEQSKFGIIYALKAIPFNTTNDFCIQLYISIIDLILQPKYEDENERNSDQTNYQFYIDFQQLLAILLLNQPIDISERIFKKLLSGIEISREVYKNEANKKAIHNYLSNVHETIEKTLFYLQYHVTREHGEQTFWSLWRILTTELKRNNISSGEKIKQLFFDLKYQNEYWLNIESNKDFIEQLIKDFGQSETGFNSSVKLLSGIGSVFSPESILWLRDILSKDDDNLLLQNSNSLFYLEMYLESLTKNYLNTIRKNSKYKVCFFGIIDKMFLVGSKTAYHLREQVLTM